MTISGKYGYLRQELVSSGVVIAEGFRPPLSLQLQRVDKKIRLTWEVGLLQSLEAIGRVWSDVENAISPHDIEPTEPRSFFRVASE